MRFGICGQRLIVDIKEPIGRLPEPCVTPVIIVWPVGVRLFRWIENEPEAGKVDPEKWNVIVPEVGVDCAEGVAAEFGRDAGGGPQR